MNDKFKEKYRIPSARLKNWNYSSNGIYFITICTKHRECFFGNISEGKMELNTIGRLAHQYWLEIPDHFSCVQLGPFVIMPNHVHGVLILNKNDSKSKLSNNDLSVETRLIASLQGGITKQHNPMLHEGLGRIIRWYKGRCAFEIRQHHAAFEWQSRFYDVIVRDEDMYENIFHYIDCNPTNWKEDELYTPTL